MYRNIFEGICDVALFIKVTSRHYNTSSPSSKSSGWKIPICPIYRWLILYVLYGKASDSKYLRRSSVLGVRLKKKLVSSMYIIISCPMNEANIHRTREFLFRWYFGQKEATDKDWPHRNGVEIEKSMKDGDSPSPHLVRSDEQLFDCNGEFLFCLLHHHLRRVLLAAWCFWNRDITLIERKLATLNKQGFKLSCV